MSKPINPIIYQLGVVIGLFVPVFMNMPPIPGVSPELNAYLFKIGLPITMILVIIGNIAHQIQTHIIIPQYNERKQNSYRP